MENPPGTKAVSGSQDQLGLLLPGLNKLNYDNGYWPVSIESVTDDAVLNFIADKLWLVALPQRQRDMDILKAHGVSVIHDPTSNLKLGSGFAPIRQMMDKGINVTLGTDGTASNNNLNMFEEMHLAEIMHDGYHNDPTLISTQEVLDMATVNGAKLQGRDDTGVLAVCKKADIIAIDLSKPHLYPNFDTPALLTCSAQAGDVCMTMVDGNILYENGEFKTLDENKVRADMERAVERLYRK